jgi:hypothetical protein
MERRRRLGGIRYSDQGKLPTPGIAMSEIQALRFPVAYWRLKEALHWAAAHGFVPIKVSLEGRQWSLRLHDPSIYEHYAVKTVKPRRPIRLVIGFYAPATE